MRRRLDPSQCEHPNEVPNICPCKPGCYCQHGRSCDPRGASRRSKTAGNKGKGSRWITTSRRMRIYVRDSGYCVWCGCDVAGQRFLKATLDHLIPRALGGGNESTNLITSCRRCNELRGCNSAIEWVMRLAPTEEKRLKLLERVLKHVSMPLPKRSK